MIKQFTRTFHPVGQGAFYTENIVTDNGQSYNVVYDCGSVTADVKVNMEQQVKDAFGEDYIDLLFISHFHDDHINGIKYLKSHYNIRKVVMPLLDNTAKVLAHASLLSKNEDTTIIHNPQAYFGDDTTIVQVNPMSDNTQEGNDYMLEDFPYRTTINSGDKILVDADWYYIPYNYKYNERLTILNKRLNDAGIDINSLDLEKALTTTVLDIYKSITGNHNLYSLILYSGNRNTKLVTFNKKFCYERRFWRNSSGCLYLGDINLKHPTDIVSCIKRHLSSFWKTISILQIPHHGAKPNYNSAIMYHPSIKFAVISHRIGSSHHPAEDVVKDLRSMGKYVFSVTEDKESIVIQFKR